MDFLKLPFSATPPDPAELRQLLRAHRHHPLFPAILRFIRDHAIGSLTDAATTASAGDPSAFQLGAATGCCDVGSLLHEMATSPEEEGEGKTT